jgi:hypothetical protein
VSKDSVRKARDSGGYQSPPERVGRDGKSYPAKSKRPARRDTDEGGDDLNDDPENYRTAFLLRTDLARNAVKDCERLIKMNAEGADPSLTRDIPRAARAVARAWSALALTLEKSL